MTAMTPAAMAASGSRDSGAVGLAASLDGWQGLNPPDRNARLRERIQSMWANADWRAHSGSGIRGNLRIPYVVPWGRAHFRP